MHRLDVEAALAVEIAPSRSATPTMIAPPSWQNLARVIADVAEPLHDDALALEAGRQPERLHVVGVRAGLAEAEVDARGRSPPCARARRPG